MQSRQEYSRRPHCPHVGIYLRSFVKPQKAPQADISCRHLATQPRPVENKFSLETDDISHASTTQRNSPSGKNQPYSISPHCDSDFDLFANRFRGEFCRRVRRSRPHARPHATTSGRATAVARRGGRRQPRWTVTESKNIAPCSSTRFYYPQVVQSL